MTAAVTIPLEVADDNLFNHHVIVATGRPLHALSTDTIQVNVGLTCNLACRHCHVEASPKRTEQMNWETMLQVMDAAKRSGARTIDITGGEPALNPHFREFVTLVRSEEIEVVVRTDLTIMLDEGHRDLPEFLRVQRVHLIASLPCYLPDNVNRQRGARVYERSIEAIRRLNAVGYGIEADLALDLVYNPLGPVLPPVQRQLEAEYRRQLRSRFGIEFHRLITITNMPIGRFLYDLQRNGDADAYERMLRESFNLHTLGGLMCRHQVHVSWDGTLHDCDFNYALGLVTTSEGSRHIRDFDAAKLAKRRICTGGHCFACTAGNGSSCNGALA